MDQVPLIPPSGLQVVWDESGLVPHYISDRLGASFANTNNGWLITLNGKMIAAVMMYDIIDTPGVPKQCTIAGAAETPRWFTKKTISAICQMFYSKRPYGLGMKRLNSLIQVSNEHSIVATERIGFKREGLLRKAGPDGEDLVVLGMLPEECPWFEADDEAPQQDNNPREQIGQV